ncbi:MAG: ATP-binding protein [Ruminococcus sp.]|nr:ATP-binding protein [Ruminococcus sp.]
MKEIELKALKENLPQVLSFVDGQLEELGCAFRIITQIDIAVEEIFVNISSYAYDPETGPAAIRVEIREDPLSVVISFTDSGKPYDPLAKPDPDIDLPLHQRPRGGLGIFMVKKTMDDVTYEYKDGQNILTIKKTLDG